MSRPAQHLIAALRGYSNLSKDVDTFRQSKGKDLPNWHDYCFLPLAAWCSIITSAKQKEALTVEEMSELHDLAAAGTWRYSQGMYRFDPDIYAAVIDSEISGDLPSDVLTRLPEWCLYVETPDLQAFDQPCHGFWVWLEHDMNHGHTELRILLDLEQTRLSVPLYLGDWPLKTAIDKYMTEAGLQFAKMGRDWSYTDDLINTTKSQIMPIVSMILYICSDAPDISGLAEPERKPSNPQPKKTKQGWRLFPAEKPRFWTVGGSYGELLRRDIDDWQRDTGRKVRPHLRRGHYHTYWTGKRGDQKAVLKFIMPIIVGSPESKPSH